MPSRPSGSDSQPRISPKPSPRATTFTVEGVSIPTASIDDLIESKRTGRLQDAADIEVLEEIRRRLGS